MYHFRLTILDMYEYMQRNFAVKYNEKVEVLVHFGRWSVIFLLP